MLLYICIIKIKILWTCHHTTLENLKLQISSPIVLIEVLTIVLKEGRRERGYNPETPCNFPHQSSVMSIWMTHPPKL